MYNLRYYNPRLAGSSYRGARKCGKTNCRCALARKYWHPFYVLEYRERVNGRWERKREYVPKPKVKALRQRIRRAKKRDLQTQQNTRDFLDKVPCLIERIKSNPFDISAVDDAGKLVKSLDTKTPFTRSQKWRIIEILSSTASAVVSPPNRRNE